MKSICTKEIVNIRYSTGETLRTAGVCTKRPQQPIARLLFQDASANNAAEMMQRY